MVDVGRIARPNRADVITGHQPKRPTPYGFTERPQPPVGLLDEVRAGWHAFWDDPELTRYIAETDVPLVKRLFTMRDELQRMHRQVKEDGPMVDGKSHPLIPKIATLEGVVGRTEDRLLLSPASRARAGVTYDGKRDRGERLKGLLGA